MCFFYVRIGIDHFVNPEYYLNIVPPYLKFQYELVSNVFSEIYTLNFDSKKNLVSHINKLGFNKTFMSGSGPSLYVFTENESESYFIQVSKNNTKNINVNFVKPIDKFEL